ncbi:MULTISPECIES: ABC transporter permease [unclassified Chelatococcus]|uniref:ABC transporter permease n=1 Tax=unclassified Chelatococcus TaxID=2638111 RepID=UPI001BD036B7|nr:MULTISPECIES: ABC transporter permease [unclassified Chelatococcus]MBS7743453.1 ABC transporter permease [Chelatococcus sp. HY11]MBX3547107.1 ABC transporter permease [Chelatococcus sp.]CAH1663726.1 Amino acid/amide ABC transporter membrane protein 1 (HAAT family) /amino acid/amide ABC transporter membrane protein 2 (HAAT family) [Hyphomicrobiales bacterium]CAH1687867.1 Amino acid/amide ABC transporter membrane protein 1 (HAAT family) /amino acid/amide ABC transporter membrane protein 2 (HAA
MLDQILFAVANGLASGMAVFLVAAGVTLIFGLLRILNFAQGSFFMVGAYVAFSITGTSPGSLWSFLFASVVAGATVAALGLLTEKAIFRRLRKYDEAYTLIATFALMMALDGAVKLIWGLNYHSTSSPPALAGVFIFGPVILPLYSVFLIGLGLAVFVLLEFGIHRLWIGKIVQSLASDQWMSGYVGINVPAMLTLTVVAAFFLAGLAGGLLLPNQSLSPALSHAFLLLAFIAVIIGGLGNIRGAFMASLVLGLVDSLNAVLLPDQPGIAMYVAMVGCMLWRPAGILSAGTGDQTVHNHASGGTPIDWSRYRPSLIAAGIVLAIAVAAMPLWANPGLVFLAGIALVAALFALSWNFLFGTTGLATFGHAAFFAIGAYSSALMLKATGGQWFLLILLASAAIGCVVAAAAGSIAIRRTTGIALAILTLALSEIMRLLISSSSQLGRDDGVSGIPRPQFDLGFVTISLQSTSQYFWFLFVVCGLTALVLWWITAGRFGRVLRAIKQDPERTTFLGINIARARLLSFMLSGTVATFAGALQTPWVQIVTPEAANYLVSMQPMLSTLLGGASFFWGPVIGTILFFIIDQATRSLAGLSEVVTGSVLLIFVMLAPDGMLGLIGHLRKQKSTPSAARGGATEVMPS